MTFSPALPTQSGVTATSRPMISMGYPCLVMGGLPLALMTRDEAARFLVRAGSPGRRHDRPPLYVTSANGEVLARAHADPAIHALFVDADMIHADGQAMVFASRLRYPYPFPERVATTDLFHDAAALAETTGTSFYLLGASADVMEAALAAIRRRYPRLVIAGARHGYIAPEEEEAVATAIAAARPGILWVGMGVPREQAFVARNRHHLTGVGAIKTAGGLFDFIAGRRSRAPLWMQKAGLEWLYRAMLEPKRLGIRYLITSPIALAIMLRKPEPDQQGMAAGDPRS